MKKIYFLHEHPIKLGNVVEYRGFRATVTEELIELNPELFRVEKNTQPMYFKCIKGEGEYNKGRIYKQVDSTGYPKIINLISEKGYDLAIYNWQSVYINESRKCFELTTKEEWDKQELIDEAKRRYPIGTVYKHFNSEYTINSPDMLTVSAMNHHFSFGTSIWVTSEAYNGVVYEDGKWAEILPLKFTTEDGVDIYGDMKTYLVHPKDIVNIDYCHGLWGGNSTIKYDKYFYHKENALAYIEKHKEKTLEDYENMLLRTDIDSINAREVCWFYNTLKGKEPKLYYTKILQLIADDLNGGWVADFNSAIDKKYHISYNRIDFVWTLNAQGIIVFKSEDLAEKARALLGDKVKYLFN